MGLRRPRVSVQTVSQAELDQRQEQFEAQMQAQREQNAVQVQALQQQYAQQAQIAEEQRSNLLAQLEAAGNAAGTNYLSQLLNVLASQASSAQEAKANRENEQAQDTFTSVQANRAKSSQIASESAKQSTLTELARKRKRYV